MSATKADWIACGACNRGGHGNDKDEGWIKQDEVLEILARHEFPDNIDGVCDQNIELRLIAEEIESLPRHAAPSQEPLAVLSDRKGLWVNVNHHCNIWNIHFGVKDSVQDAFLTERWIEENTYAAAESAARNYLLGLPDSGKGGR